MIMVWQQVNVFYVQMCLNSNMALKLWLKRSKVNDLTLRNISE